MKKYSKPQIEIVEMETAQVVATSMEVKEVKSDLQLQDRRRGNRWGEYE